MPATFNYKLSLEKSFNLKQQEDPDVFHGLKAIASEFILMRAVEDMQDEDIAKINITDFSEPEELVAYLQKEIPDFKKKFNSYFKEFVKEHGFND